MAATKSAALVDSAYTLITDGLTPVFIAPNGNAEVRIVVADALPAVGVDTYVTLPPTGLNITGLVAANNVYARTGYGTGKLRWLEGSAAA